MKPSTREVIAKMMKVIRSSRTIEQKRSARRYFNLAMPYMINTRNKSMTNEQVFEFIAWVVFYAMLGLACAVTVAVAVLKIIL